MSFSFSTTAGASQGALTKRLEGNAIYTVKFDGCEIVDIKGVKDPTQEYKIIKLKFSNELGTYEHPIFEPKKEDFTRTEKPYTDKTTGEQKVIPQPSGVESMMLFFKHAIDAINPTIGAAIDAGTKNLGAANWSALRLLVAEILDKGKGTSVEIKLIKNTKGEATLPGFFASINKEGKAYLKNNFIGKNLAFTTYEATRINTMATAKPTPAATYDAPVLSASAEVKDDALDFDIAIL